MHLVEYGRGRPEAPYLPTVRLQEVDVRLQEVDDCSRGTRQCRPDFVLDEDGDPTQVGESGAVNKCACAVERAQKTYSI
jgi:hypothetical protein